MCDGRLVLDPTRTSYPIIHGTSRWFPASGPGRTDSGVLSEATAGELQQQRVFRCVPRDRAAGAHRVIVQVAHSW